MANATKITKKPSKSVTSLSTPNRVSGTHKLRATWKVPSSLVDSKKNDRATELKVTWTLGLVARSDPKEVEWKTNEKATSDTIDLNNVTIGRTTYTRNSFYPRTKSRKLSFVTVRVQAKNDKGIESGVKEKRTFHKPRKPSISALSFNADNGVVSATITTDAGNDYYERDDTWYTMEVTNPFENGGKKRKVHDTNTQSTSKTITYDASQYMRLDPDKQVIKIVVDAYARGYAGDSEKATPRTMYISYPAQASITGVSVPKGRDSTGKTTVNIKTNSTNEHPVDKVRLEYAADVTYDNANDIPASEWTSSDIVDNGNCTALSVATSELIPSRGNHTFIRVVTYHLHEGVLYRYSKPWKLTQLEVKQAPSASIDVDIISARTGADGKSAVVLIGWNKDGLDDFTGTEISWAETEDTWRSTQDPNSYRFVWSDGRYPKTGTKEYNDSAEITIKGLSESKTYYIKARRYLEAEIEQTSNYTASAVVTTNEAPESIVAYCDSTVADGDPLTVYWTLAGNGIQKEWQIVRVAQYAPTTDTAVAAQLVPTPTTSELLRYYEIINSRYVKTSDTSVVEGKDYYVIGKTYYTFNGTAYTAVASPADSEIANYYDYYSEAIIKGEGSAGATQISAETLKKLSVNGVFTFYVQASTGSGLVPSAEKSVRIVTQPTLSITAPATMTAQPYSFTAVSNALCNLIVIVTSQGASGQFPQGKLRQIAGDTIYSDVITPVWAADGNNWSTTVTLPSGLDFWDLGKYTISVVAVDTSTNLRSPEVITSFGVEWANRAVSPVQFSYVLTSDTEVVENEAYYELVENEYISVTPVGSEDPSEEGWYIQVVTKYVTLNVIDETDADGDHRQAVRINLTPPTGCSETDVYDIYRMDVDKPHLISNEGFPLTYTAVDEYAPFGEGVELNYRIALRTIDGDVEFADISYSAECKNIRFDWANGSLELPYGNAISDSFGKDVDVRQHMNGSSDGYWNPNIRRKSSLNSSVIKILQPRDIERVRSLARYAGVVFVRLPNGSAFEADVQVTDLSIKNKAVTAVAFDATEVGLTEEFMLPTPFEKVDEEEA